MKSDIAMTKPLAKCCLTVIYFIINYFFGVIQDFIDLCPDADFSACFKRLQRPLATCSEGNKTEMHRCEMLYFVNEMREINEGN